MSDIFISYARSTETVAHQVAQALRDRGHKVWRDDELPAHRNYGEVIEERLRGAKAVVVVWSAEALTSQWVRAEADVARETGTLVQLSTDGTVPPLPFNQIQGADLRGWAGDANHSGWIKVADSVAALAGPALGATAGSDPGARKEGGLTMCVLPFINMSGDSEQEYFSDGITEDIITDLSKVSALDVVARNTAFAFKGQVVDIKQLAKDLGLSHVIEGSVRKAGERVRITAQLIEGSTGNHVWADRYDRELDDIFAIQDEISTAIVDALKLELLPKEKKAISGRSTESSEAYDLYLMARQHWVKSTGVDRRLMEITIRICKQAVMLDPGYAKAWGLMALGQVRMHIDHDPSVDPSEAIEQALSHDPENVEGLCAKAIMVSGQGDQELAQEMLLHALEQDPKSFEVQKEVARHAFLNGNFDAAITHYENALAMMDDDYHSAGMLVTCYHAKGDRDQEERVAKICVERVERALKRDPGDGSALSMGIAGLATLGDKERVLKWTDRAMMVDPDNHLMRYNLACTLVCELEDFDRAVELLGPYFDNITPKWIQHIEADPDMDKIRDPPRFKAMLDEATQRTGKPKVAAS